MKIFSWNIQGGGSATRRGLIREVIRIIKRNEITRLDEIRSEGLGSEGLANERNEAKWELEKLVCRRNQMNN